jgi:hypothetical protein
VPQELSPAAHLQQAQQAQRMPGKQLQQGPGRQRAALATQTAAALRDSTGPQAAASSELRCAGAAASLCSMGGNARQQAQSAQALVVCSASSAGNPGPPLASPWLQHALPASSGPVCARPLQAGPPAAPLPDDCGAAAAAR